MDKYKRRKCYPEYNAKRKDATMKTKLIHRLAYEEMDWDRLEIERELAEDNLVVEVPLPVIRREDSIIPVWDMKRYEFLLEDDMPDTVHPKLWEQGKMNMNVGVYQITENIYQVRGYDLANIGFIRGKTGWIIMDCLTSLETAKAAIQLVKEHIEDLPITGIICTHSHVDHYGGVLGVLESGVVDGVRVLAPKGFTESVIEENINAGVAMSRRGVYMYGEALLRDEKGQIDSGIGKYASIGHMTFTDLVDEINQGEDEKYVERVVDGILMQFLLTLDTEAPSEMDIYIPSEKSLCIAENCTATLHNIYTLRGAEVRDPVAWAEDIQKAIDLWGDELTSVFMVHTWPRFGREYCIDFMEKQRDMYQYINDQTLRLINKGFTLEEVGRMVKFPKSLSQEWYNSPFYGTVSHNAKAVYQRYIGWYNSNPVDLNRLMPTESAKKYVAYMGGEDCVMKKARVSYLEGDYQWVAEVMKQVIYANPDNQNAKYLCADALEQLGYIAESGPWRNEYLMGAKELRHGNTPMPGTTITDDVLDAIPLKNVLYLFSIRLNGLEAGNVDYKMNFIITDREEAASTEVKRGIFRYLTDGIDIEAAVTVIMNKETLYKLAITNDIPDPSDIIVEGDRSRWLLFLALLDELNTDFNIVTPAK